MDDQTNAWMLQLMLHKKLFWYLACTSGISNALETGLDQKLGNMARSEAWQLFWRGIFDKQLR